MDFNIAIVLCCVLVFLFIVFTGTVFMWFIYIQKNCNCNKNTIWHRSVSFTLIHRNNLELGGNNRYYCKLDPIKTIWI